MADSTVLMRLLLHMCEYIEMSAMTHNL